MTTPQSPRQQAQALRLQIRALQLELNGESLYAGELASGKISELVDALVALIPAAPVHTNAQVMAAVREVCNQNLRRSMDSEYARGYSDGKSKQSVFILDALSARFPVADKTSLSTVEPCKAVTAKHGGAVEVPASGDAGAGLIFGKQAAAAMCGSEGVKVDDKAQIKQAYTGIYTPEFIREHIALLDRIIADAEKDTDTALPATGEKLSGDDLKIIERVRAKLPKMIEQVFGAPNAERAESDRVEAVFGGKCYVPVCTDNGSVYSWVESLRDGKPGWKRFDAKEGQ